MLKTATIFQDKMVLQRQKPVFIWGTQTADSEVTAKIQGKQGVTRADENGNWTLSLPPLEASEDEQLIICSGTEQIIFNHVAIGEVWLAGGQSNMELWMKFEAHRDEELADCPLPRLRFFDVPEIAFDGQAEAFDYSRFSIWREATAEDLDYFSAVAYYFQKELSQALDIPIGIIGCNWGGTTTSAWMNPETTARVGKPWIDDYENAIKDRDITAYWQAQIKDPSNDTGNPLEDPFTNYMLEATRTTEEIDEHYGFSIVDFMQKRRAALKPIDIPGSLYEHMLKTIALYSIRGVIWYQGENDDAKGHGDIHDKMLAGLIADWRKLWSDDLPFLIVQLTGFEQWSYNTAPNNYPIVRECQQKVADTVDGVFLCSISDAGEQYEIHPKNKKIVGKRLALLARGHIYQEDLLCDAPRAVLGQRRGNEITLCFDHAEGGLYREGDELQDLRVISEGKELSYTATIQNDQLLLTLDQLEQLPEAPVHIEFATTPWICVNLYNYAHIPAVPFRIEC